MQRSFTLVALIAIVPLTLAQQEFGLISEEGWTKYLNRDYRNDDEYTASKKPKNPKGGWQLNYA